MKVTMVEVTCKLCAKTDTVFSYRASEETCSACASDLLMAKTKADFVADPAKGEAFVRAVRELVEGK